MTYHYLMDLALILLSTKVLGILTKRITINESAAVQVRDTVVRQRAVTRVPSRVRVIRVS